MRMYTFLALSVFTIAAATPTLAQDAMASHDQMQSSEAKMSAADMHKMKACNAMSHDKMMKSASCKKLMTAHPDMMKQADAMHPGH